MAYRLAAELSDRIAAIAPVAGSLATEIGLRATLLTVGVLAVVLVAVAVVGSPVRRHRKMPSIASD